MSNQNSSSSRESDFDNDDSFADPDFEVETDVETRVGKSILSPSRQPLRACTKIEHLASTSKCLFPSNLEKNNCDLTELDCGPSNENLISIPSDYQSTESASNCSPLPKRKKSDPRLWKQHVRQQLRETGQQYVNIDGKTMPARIVKQPCKNSCFYLCTMNFTSHDRELTNAAFWALTNQEKKSFYCKIIKREVVKRRRIRDSIKKRYSYNYYLQSEGRIHKVCKTLFINTLNISVRRIYYYFQNLNDHSTGSPIPSKKGKNTKRATPPEQIRVRDPCRSSSTKKYLDAHLTVAKMYTLYRESRSSPVKESVYRKQFQAFNLSFHRPKKDQCDRCVLFKSNRNPTEEQISQQNAHKDDKIAMRAEREVDRQNGEPKHAIICFDLQSVFALPKGNASAFYYKRKLSLFNMTATCILINKPKITYCAMWSEVDSGRTGDDIASSIIKILLNFILFTKYIAGNWEQKPNSRNMKIGPLAEAKSYSPINRGFVCVLLMGENEYSDDWGALCFMHPQ